MMPNLSHLAINGGAKAVKQALPPMYPGGMRVGAEEEEAVIEVIRSKRLFRYYGPNPGKSKTDELETAFSARIGARHALAVSSGSAALVCALIALGAGPGDEVIVPAYTWIASASAVLAAGAVPILAEVDESLTLDPADVARKITRHTRVIMAVHMRGAPCNMDGLSALARQHGIKLLEDVAQAAGASYRGAHLGSIGHAGAFSFQYNKIITCGEGGMVTTNDFELFRRTAMYHDVIGGIRNGVPPAKILPGVNLRMSELQAAVALVQFRRLDSLLAEMRQHNHALKASMADVSRRKGITFRKQNDAEGDTDICLVFYLPQPATAQRVVAALAAEGLPATVLHRPGYGDYHVYCNWLPIVDKRTWSVNGGPWRWHEGPVEYPRDQCPRTLDLLSRAVHIDISPDLTRENIEEMAAALNKVLDALA